MDDSLYALYLTRLPPGRFVRFTTIVISKNAIAEFPSISISQYPVVAG